MVGLRFLRQIVGLVWIGIAIWGVISLLSGQWLQLMIAVVVWILVALVFVALHSALERSELNSAAVYYSSMVSAVEFGFWPEALHFSKMSVELLRAGANRDKTAFGQGNGKNMAGPLGMALVCHGMLLGANGLLFEAELAIDQGFPVMQQFAPNTPEFRNLLEVADALRGPGTTVERYQQGARFLHSVG